MSCDHKELEEWIKRLQSMKADVPQILSKLIVQEGETAVTLAKKRTKEEHVFNTGNYMANWGHDKTAKHSGNAYLCNFYNHADYAIHLEYGFRSHFVPGYWDGNSFVHDPNAKSGMVVGPYGGYVPGHYIMQRSVKALKSTQQERLQRRLKHEIKKRL